MEPQDAMLAKYQMDEDSENSMHHTAIILLLMLILFQPTIR